MIKQSPMPQAVGIIAAAAVHFRLPVSFLIVISVVEQGQCIKEKIMVQTAVMGVQPFCRNISLHSERFVISLNVPCDRYIIIIMGTTISLAGKPSIKASKIVPSSPICLPNGSRKSAVIFKIEESPMLMLASNHISIPAGAATAAARPRTKSVRSKTERMIILPICGGLYGGSSRVNEEGTPFKIVAESNRVTMRVVIIPKSIIVVSKSVDKREEVKPAAAPIKNIVIIDISVGKAQQNYGKKILILSSQSIILILSLFSILFLSSVERRN